MKAKKILKVVLIGGAVAYGIKVAKNMRAPRGILSTEGKRNELLNRANGQAERDGYLRMQMAEIDMVYDYVSKYTWLDKVGPDGLRVMVNGLLAKYSIAPVRI